MTTDLPRVAASPSPLLRFFIGSSLTDGLKAVERKPDYPLPHLHRDRRREALSHFGTELRTSARAPSAAPRPLTTERRSRCPAEERGPSRRGQLGAAFLEPVSSGQFGVSSRRPILRPVWPITGAGGGGDGEGEPTLPAQLSGQCQCKCQGDVPTQAGEPAAPVPERNNT